MISTPRATSRRGITLVELLLAIGLIVLVSGMMFEFYNAVVRSREEGSRRMIDSQLARSVAMRIAEEVRAANGFVKDIGPGISGDDRVITIQTATLTNRDLLYQRSIQDEPLPAECDIRQVQYYLAYDEEEAQYDYPDGTQASAPLGLVRRELKTLLQPRHTTTTQPLLGSTELQPEVVDLDLFAPEMKYVRFRYFDGVDWIDKWDIGRDMEGQMGNALPQAVEITVGYSELPPKEEEEDLDQDPDLIPSLPEPYAPETYTIVVRLPQADTFFGSRLMRAQRRSRRGVGASGTSM